MAKLTEECGELVSILGRCAAQGVDGVDPETSVPNRHALEDEIADVRALSECVIRYLRLNDLRIRNRALDKIAIKTGWLDQVPT
jgi:NTP pyrophosphatase (non-canonical NTP hydrolase)